MPELPSVQHFKTYLDATAVGSEVEGVHVDAAQEVTGVTQRTLARRLRHHVLSGTRRHGKNLFVALDDGDAGWLRMHFGMSGDLRYWTGGAPDDLDRDHVRLRLDLKGDGHLAWICVRRLGALEPVKDPDAWVEDNDLGPDALDDAVDRACFRERVGGRRGSLKGALMNQSVLAGVGSEYADEILYQAELHPESRVPALTDDDLDEIRRVMRRVLRTAVERDADPDALPASWLLRRREQGRACSRCDGTIVKLEVSGRPTYACDTHQRKVS